MSYMEKINKVYNKYVKDFKRKDETFNMICINDFLYQEYLENMYKWYEHLNSDEYKNRNIYC